MRDACFGGVAFAVDFDGDQKLRFREGAKLLRFVRQCFEVRRLAHDSTEVEFVEIDDVDLEAVVIGLDCEKIFAPVIGILAPAVFPTAEGVVGRESSLSEESDETKRL